jgi:hypothetical protein
MIHTYIHTFIYIYIYILYDTHILKHAAEDAPKQDEALAMYVQCKKAVELINTKIEQRFGAAS